MTIFMRIISFLLTVVMVTGMLPMPHAHAEETEEYEHQVVETVPATTAEALVKTAPETEITTSGTEETVSETQETAPADPETVPETEILETVFSESVEDMHLFDGDGLCSCGGVSEGVALGHGEFINGFCSVCDGYEAAVLNGDVYEISNAGQLYWFAEKVNSGETAINGKLTDNIVINEDVLADDGNLNSGTYREWIPIGSWTSIEIVYSGVFDGNDKTISGLYYNRSGVRVGLFGDVDNGTIQNIGLVDSYISGGHFVGGIVGGASNAKVSNCYNESTITGDSSAVGGIVGTAWNGEITACHNTGRITGEYEGIGGIVGGGAGATVTDCYNTGSVSGGICVGGISGENSGVVSNCYNTGNISGTAWIGGVSGDVAVTYSGNEIYGIGGMTNCYNHGTVEGKACIGGVVGQINGKEASVSNCYNTGKVTATEECGGGVIGTSNGIAEKNYYLKGAAEGGINGADVAGSAEAKAAEQFKLGEVAYLLGDAFGQTIGTEELPVLEGEKVYKNRTGCCTKESFTYEYSNAASDPVTTHIMVDATCEKAEYCSRCGITEGEPLGHDYVETEVEATCTQGGYKESRCSRCGKGHIYDETGSLGHNYEALVIAPTCTTDGCTMHTCSTCGDFYADAVVAKLGHTEAVDEAVTPTCTATGLTEGKHCSSCNTVFVAQQIIPETGIHQYQGSRCVHCGAIGGTCGPNATWRLEEGCLTVSGEGAINGYVYGEAPWFNWGGLISSLVVEDGITIIGGGAFRCCMNLVEVSLPESLQVISEAAFQGCEALEIINLPEQITTIGDSAFSECGLKEIDIPGSVKSIGRYAFSSIGLSKITLHEGLENIGEYAFSACPLTELTLPSTLRTIGANAFSYWISSGGENTFKEVVIPEGVISVGEQAFWNREGLRYVSLPATLTDLGYGAFGSCSALEEIELSPENTTYVVQDNVVFTADRKTLHTAAGGKTGAYTIPDMVTHIADYAFTSCGKLEAVTIPEGVTSAGVWTFNGCDSLTEIIVPASLTVVPNRFAAVCRNLRRVQLLGSVTSIGHEAFAFCDSLEFLNIPETVTSLGNYAFRECNKLSAIVFRGDAPSFGTQVFLWATVNAYYPKDNNTWSAAKRANHGGTVTWRTCCTGTLVVTDEAKPATCTESGLTEGTHCSICGTVLVKQEVIPALGHAEIVDAAVAPSCIATGLTEGKHCERCGEILVVQKVVPVIPHAFVEGVGSIRCAICHDRIILRIAPEQITLNRDRTYRLPIEVSPADLADDVIITLEPGGEDVISVAQDGTVTILAKGTAFVEVSLVNQGIKLSDRCRIDVVDLDALAGIQLDTAKVTLELFSTAYPQIGLLLKKPENSSASASGENDEQNMDAAIEDAWFSSPSANLMFDLVVLDDRSVLVVPTEEALANPGEVKTSYKTAVSVMIQGKEYTSEPMTLTVKKTLPKLKAKVDPLNAFYPELEQRILISGATVTNISLDPDKAQPNWVTLEDDILKLNEKAVRKNASGQLNLLVETEEWAVPAAVALTVKNAYKEPTLKLSTKNIQLNTAVKDTAQVTVTSTPAVEDFDFRLTDSTGKVDKTGDLDVVCKNGVFTIGTTEQSSGTYKLHISTNGSKETAITIRVISAIPSVIYKVKGNPDLNIPEQYAEITPSFRNYSGSFFMAEMKVQTSKKKDSNGQIWPEQDVSERFWAKQVGGSIHVFCADNTPVGTYTLRLKLILNDGSRIENTTKVNVKQTALKVKLGATRLTLNKVCGDEANVAVTSATKGYILEMPVWNLMDKTGKTSAEGKLDISWTDGRLRIATNAETKYGATYKLLVKANADAPAQTLTITIPAEKNTKVTANLKTKGSIDVIRSGSALTITPTYKNCSAETEKEETLIFSKTVGKETTDANDLFAYTKENGVFTVTKADGAVLDHSAKYTVKLVTTIHGTVVAESKPVNLSVKMGTAKLTVKTSDTMLFAKDQHDRALVWFEAADTTLNAISRVEIKNAKQAAMFELIDYGDGSYAIGFKDGKVDKSLVGKNVTVALNVFLEGNQTAKVNVAANVKVTVVK